MAAVNRVLAEHGLPPIDSVGQLLLGDRTLVLGMPETDPLPDGVDVTYVGPILWQHGPDELPPSLANLDPSYTANARRLSERMRAFGGGAKVAGIIERAERPRGRRFHGTGVGPDDAAISEYE